MIKKNSNQDNKIEIIKETKIIRITIILVINKFMFNSSNSSNNNNWYRKRKKKRIIFKIYNLYK